MLSLSTGLSNVRYWVFLVLVLYVLVISVEVFLRKIIIVIPDTEPYRAAIVYGHGERGKRVAVGDSHVEQSFFSDGEAVNLGRSGSGIGEIEPMLMKYVELHAPDQVIIEVGPQQLSARNVTRSLPEGSYEQGLLPTMMYIFEPAVATKLKQLFEGLDIVASIRRLKQKKRDYERRMLDERIWSNLTREERLRQAADRSDAHTPVWNEMSRRAIGRFERLIEFLVDRRIEVCLLRTPVTSEYLELTMDNESFIRAEQVFKAMARKFQVRYVDFRDLDIDWDGSKFVNQDHIRREQSQVFSSQSGRACFGQHDI